MASAHAPLDSCQVLLHLLIGYMCQEADIVVGNQQLSLVAERNLQTVGAAYRLRSRGRQCSTKSHRCDTTGRTVTIFPVLLVLRPEFLKPDWTAAVSWRRDQRQD